MLADVEHVSFVPVEPGHYALLRTWFATPHMQAWWGDPETELGYIRDMVEGRDSTRPFLIVVSNTPVGYIQYWFVDDHQNAQWIAEHPWLRELPSGAIGVDLSIGDPQKLSIGIGSTALTAFVSMLRAKGHQTIIIDPDPRNTRAVRAYAKAGFRPVPALAGRTDDVLIMQHELHANEAAFYADGRMQA
jgi:RimJ/RimL family protein N-acetyltransferase